MADLKTLVEREMRRAGQPSYSLADVGRRRRRSERNRRVGTAAVALALVAAAIGGLAEAFRGPDPAPRPAGLPTTPRSWTRHVVEPSDTGAGRRGPILVAAGNRGILAFTESGTCWDCRDGREFMAVSPDGRSWTTLTGEGAPPMGLEGVGPVAAWERGFIAVGEGGEIWRSEDGQAWDSAASALDRPVWGVAPGGPGLVAVGPGNRAWFSSDGVDWEPARVPPPPEGVYPGDDGRSPTVFMSDVAVAGERLVAAGRADRPIAGTDDEWSYQQVLWASPDGMSWTDVTDPELFPEGSDVDVRDVAGGPQGFVAVGYDREGFALWTSPDGLEWERVPTDAFAGSDPGMELAVAGGPAGYVAVTTRESQAAVWTSPDGRAWSRVPADPVFRGEAGDVVAWGSRFVIGGVDDGRAVVWISDDAGKPTAPTPRPTSVPTSGPFARVLGWIAYNDGTGIWAVDPRKAYRGTFSPTRFPDDTVRLAGPAAGDPIAWSADGSRLLIRRPSGEDLFVLEADGTETQVTDSALFGGASISPDGTQVVYVRGIGPGGDPHPYRLEVATVGDGPPEVLLSSQEGHLGSPAFSPDGGRIAFIAGGGDHSNALWVIDADGTNRRKLAGGDWSHARHLVWSPDGERLAFSCRCPSGQGVYTIRADGTRLSLMSADGSMPVPQWSPDGSQIAFVREDEDQVVTVGQPTRGTLVGVAAEGGEERQLVRFQLFRVDDLGNVRPVTIAWNPVR